jgi:CBS domain-containing protein
MMVEHILTSVAIRLKRSASLQEAARLMRDHHVGAVLVTEDGETDQPAGIVTDRDIAIHAAAEGRSLTGCAVEDVMTPGVITVPKNARVSEALELMRENGVRRLVVVNDSGGLAGVISLDDIIEAMSVDLASVGATLHGGLRREIARTSGAL